MKTPNFTESLSAGARIGSDYIGITKNGAISIYAGFYRKNDIKSFARCKLLIDKVQNLIGLQFGGEELGNGAYKLNHDENHKTASISASNFFTLNELKPLDWYGKYPPEKFDDGVRKNVYMIDLEQKIVTKRKENKPQN